MNRAQFLIAMFALFAIVAACSDDSTLAADAGTDFSVAVGEAPEFDGCDSGGDIDNYAWQIVEAPPDMADDTGKFLRETSADCSFVLDSSMVVADVGTWVVELTVSTGAGDAAVDRVTVTVS